ncbi:MAG: DUF2384 domain-containing protein [Deltaproteobacteria bacterium]|nr:DUF2384 domain-containing protein [Deltaproteobacteria bacterium]
MAKKQSKGPVTWEAFTERLREIYWPSLAPEARLLTRPDPPAGDPVVPDDVWQAAVTVFPDAENWLHNAVPSLGGKSPLQALGKGQLAEVKQLIMGVADFFLPDPDEVVSWEDAMAAEAEATSGDPPTST